MGPNTDSGIIKKILHAGIKQAKFKDGSKVHFHFETRLSNPENTLIDDSRKIGDGKPMHLILGKKFKLEVWEAIVQNMAIKEVAQFAVNKSLVMQYPFVSKTLRDAQVPAEERKSNCCAMTVQQTGVGYADLNNLMKNPCDLEFTIELVDVEDPNEYRKESWQLNDIEQLQRVDQLRELGNVQYKQMNQQAASDMYAEAIGLLERLMIKEKPHTEEWDGLNKLKVPLLLNYSQCKLGECDYYAAIEHCSSVLKVEPDNVKALFRRGKAHVGAWNPIDARDDFEKVIQLDRNLACVVKKELDSLDELIKLKNNSDKEKLKGLFGMIISMPFLLLTFLVYAVLPDRNLHGKCLMCYVSTLFGAYALLIFIQLYPNSIEIDACKALGISCLFFFMVSFFWMSVMSIDIFLAFSGRRGFSGSRKEAERKRFLLYSAYAWGMPLLLVIVVTSLSVTTDVESNTWYNPGMGDGQCWLRDGIPTLLYFYLPMATLIIINITLFCTTACKIKRVQQDTAMLRKDESKKHSYENDKQRFNLYLKLLLAMGVNWSLEIISWIVDWQIGQIPPAVWYLTDFCNALYGVFVFFIFVFKQNIWKLLKKRYYMLIGKPSLARTMTQSAYSPRTTASSLNHTMTTDKSFVNDSSVLTSEVA